MRITFAARVGKARLARIAGLTVVAVWSITAALGSLEAIAATATPTVPIATPTSLPLPIKVCGDHLRETGEDCDPPGSATCPNAGNGLEICSMSCTCACPTKASFSGDAADPASRLDTGWTGIAHRAPAISNGDVTVALACTATRRPCGTCTVSGPVENVRADAGQLNDRRCLNDTRVRCHADSDCGSVGGTCQFFFGSDLPLSAGGVSTCVINQFNGALSGTANVESGDTATTVALTSRVYNGLLVDTPCPTCVGDGTPNDGTAGGTCSGGPHNTQSCDAGGGVPGRPDFGSTSLDCPPDPAALIATLPIDLTNASGPVTKTLSTTSPNCSGEPGAKCLCDTCNNATQQPCDDNGDCPASGGSPGVCGGRRCIGGTNSGAPCTNVSACPNGGLCGRPGEPTKPSACLDDTSTAGIDCTDTAPVDGEGECGQGPITQSCSLASGHAQRGCSVDADCGGAPGSCEGSNRLCFLTGGLTVLAGSNTLIAQGMGDTPMNDTSHPTLGAVFCIAPTGSTSVNSVAGLPGPGRVTLKGTASGLP